MWDRKVLHAINDEEKMDEDEEGNRDEEIRDEEQEEEEHQKARAIASFEIPSRREVGYNNITHIPFRTWCDQYLRGRGKRNAHKK